MYCVAMSSCIPWLSKLYGSGGSDAREDVERCGAARSDISSDSDVSVRSVESAERHYIRRVVSVKNGEGSGKS